MDNHEKRFQNAFIKGLTENGWVYSGTEGCSEYDRKNSVITSDLHEWLRISQPATWQKLVRKTGNSESLALRLVIEKITTFRQTPQPYGGTYNLLLNGISVKDETFHLFHPKQEPSGNSTASILYEHMILRVVSEFCYSTLKPMDAIDLGFFINGIPVGTAELKSPIAGQGVGEAERQYKNDRVPGLDMVLHPSAGALFHFAVASDLASITTALRGKHTSFIPFNTGIDNSGWVSKNENSPRTSYLWEEVLEKSNFALIVSGMMRNVESGGVHQTRFPRYHQFDNLKKITDSVREVDGRKNYLSQHAPGSGKSDEIANLAYALSQAHDSLGRLRYSSVIIITNRTVLDTQMKELLESKIRRTGYFHPIVKSKSGISKSSELASKLLKPGTSRIISVTAQTFAGTLLDTMRRESLNGREISGNYAVIVDEAHDGETGKQHENMYRALLGVSVESHVGLLADDRDEAPVAVFPPAEEPIATIEDRKILPALSFFAYTATPNADALRVFGEQETDAAGNITYVPFHTYSMSQAREEGYINDVLANYVTHERFVKIAIDDVEYEGDRIIDFASGRREIGKWIETLPEVKEVIVKIAIEKMRSIVLPALNGQGKAMLSCSSRSEAVAYKHLIDEAVLRLPAKERFKTLVAFSESVYDPFLASEVTELDSRINQGLGREKDIAKAFEGNEYRLMIVANKYQVGFDQPKLMCMFLDKVLKGINLVQTTARVNRRIPGKDHVYIFDFVNSAEEVLESFRKFDEDASLCLTYDLSTETLEEILEKTGILGIHTTEDIQLFNESWLSYSALGGSENEKDEASTQMSNVIDACAGIFHSLALSSDDTLCLPENLNEYRAMLKRFTSIYGLISITRNDPNALNAIYQRYGAASRFFDSLQKALKVSRSTDVVVSVDINALRLERYEIVSQGSIGGLKSGPVSETRANYTSDFFDSEVTPKLGPIEVLINEINDYPEVPSRLKDSVTDLVDTLISSMETDEKLIELAKGTDEKSFVRSDEVHRKIRRIISRQNRHKVPAVSILAKVITKKQERDSKVLNGIARTLHRVMILEDEHQLEVAENNPNPNRHKDSAVKVYQLIDAGLLDEGMEVVPADELYIAGSGYIYGGGIRLNGNVYSSPTIAAKYASPSAGKDLPIPNGWEFWAIKKDDGTITKFSELLDVFLEM